MSDQNNEALAHFKGAEADLANSSAAGYPESWVALTLQKIRMGIAKLEGKEIAPKPVVTDPHAVPATLNRADAGKSPVAVAAEPVTKKAFTAKYEDGTVLEEDDRTKFPPKSAGGAKRISITKN